MKHLTGLFFLFFGAILLCGSCTSQPTTSSGVEIIYFDLDTFFLQEMERLKELQIKISKTVKIGDHSEEKVQDSLVNLEQEFKLFTVHNINKSSMIGKYQVDTIQNDQATLDTIRYVTMDKKMLTKMLLVLFDTTKQIQQIEVESASSSLLMNTQSRAFYNANSGYEIKSYQHLLLWGNKCLK
ncbi:MAG: hypothetical protein HC892_08870 [Saprospiraceae bacterium]|nr:hypothetical protein [Saprospiraceae bacterium]